MGRTFRDMSKNHRKTRSWGFPEATIHVFRCLSTKSFDGRESLDCCEGLGELQWRRRREQVEASQSKGTRKAAPAERLGAETAVTLEWMVERLEREAPGCVNHLLDRRRKADKRSRSM